MGSNQLRYYEAPPPSVRTPTGWGQPPSRAPGRFSNAITLVCVTQNALLILARMQTLLTPLGLTMVMGLRQLFSAAGSAMLLFRAPPRSKMASDCPTGVVVQPRQTFPLPRASLLLKSSPSMNLTYISTSKHWPHLLTA